MHLSPCLALFASAEQNRANCGFAAAAARSSQDECGRHLTSLPIAERGTEIRIRIRFKIGIRLPGLKLDDDHGRHLGGRRLGLVRLQLRGPALSFASGSPEPSAVRDLNVLAAGAVPLAFGVRLMMPSPVSSYAAPPSFSCWSCWPFRCCRRQKERAVDKSAPDDGRRSVRLNSCACRSRTVWSPLAQPPVELDASNIRDAVADSVDEDEEEKEEDGLQY